MIITNEHYWTHDESIESEIIIKFFAQALNVLAHALTNITYLFPIKVEQKAFIQLVISLVSLVTVSVADRIFFFFFNKTNMRAERLGIYIRMPLISRTYSVYPAIFNPYAGTSYKIP